MAGAKREITDPVEAAKHGIGSSKRLIEATLDDLSAHHSWLETYHREERIRAERLRRRELRERLERGVRHAMTRTKRAARLSYVGGRRVARFSKRHALIFARWAGPRLRTLARHATDATSQTWAWTRRRAPEFAHVGTEAVVHGFHWSVRTSDEAGRDIRRLVSAASAEVAAALLRDTRPIRRRGLCGSVRAWLRRRRVQAHLDKLLAELARHTAPLHRQGASGWARTRLRARRIRAEAERRLTDAITTSQTLAQARKRLYRWTIRGLRISKPAAQRAHGAALRIEADLSNRVIRIAPEFRRLVQAHMPATTVPAEAPVSKGSRALIRRPNTALACVAPTEHKLPAPYHA
ncbi:hypothetical protein [Methyloceanibacter sp. wino2]|uniref:hypothetical protein n=1 Tax=Methyloceanibacter sp. wino2 TaxID=2170729 RepID=UPI00131F153A|nr:hypothetical protein [Methyloceanibacter sp. wino2]